MPAVFGRHQVAMYHCHSLLRKPSGDLSTSSGNVVCRLVLYHLQGSTNTHLQHSCMYVANALEQSAEGPVNHLQVIKRPHILGDYTYSLNRFLRYLYLRYLWPPGQLPHLCGCRHIQLVVATSRKENVISSFQTSCTVVSRDIANLYCKHAHCRSQNQLLCASRS